MNQFVFMLTAWIVCLLACSMHRDSSHDFQVLDFRQDSLPQQCKFEGEFLGGARFTDANGENILLVSQNFKTGVDAGVQVIFGYNYVIDSGKCRLLWS